MIIIIIIIINNKENPFVLPESLSRFFHRLFD